MYFPNCIPLASQTGQLSSQSVDESSSLSSNTPYLQTASSSEDLELMLAAARVGNITLSSSDKKTYLPPGPDLDPNFIQNYETWLDQEVFKSDKSNMQSHFSESTSSETSSSSMESNSTHFLSESNVLSTSFIENTIKDIESDWSEGEISNWDESNDIVDRWETPDHSQGIVLKWPWGVTAEFSKTSSIPWQEVSSDQKESYGSLENGSNRKSKNNGNGNDEEGEQEEEEEDYYWPDELPVQDVYVDAFKPVEVNPFQ